MTDIAIDPVVTRRRRVKRMIPAATVGAVLVALAIWAFGHTAGPSAKRSELWLATVMRGPLPITVSAAGTFRPIEQRWITAATPGVVESVRVQPGDEVHSDTILAVLANPTVESALAQARANLASAQAERASLRAQLASEMLTLQGDLATAQAEAATAGEKERAERSLLDSHIVSSLEYAGTRAKSFEYTRLVELAKLRIVAFRRSMTSQDRAAVARVAALRAALEDSRETVGALSVTAKMEGVVQDVAIHPGQTLPVGGGVARVASVKALKVVLEVPASEAGEVAVGQTVALELATEETQDLHGQIVRVSPTVNNDGVEVDVMPVGPMPADVRPNLAVTGDVHIAKISDAVYLQRPAFAGPDSAMTLYRLVDNGRAAVPVRVSFGAASDRYIQIAHGLIPGDQVIISDTGSFAGDSRITLR